MTEPPGSPNLPHLIDHRHADVSGGWLRAATFGAMDGLVSNTALIAGVGAGAAVPLTPYLLGLASLWAGLACGGAGLLLAGALASHYTRKSLLLGGFRQLTFGAVAIASTFGAGALIGAAVS